VPRAWAPSRLNTIYIHPQTNRALGQPRPDLTRTGHCSTLGRLSLIAGWLPHVPRSNLMRRSPTVTWRSVPQSKQDRTHNSKSPDGATLSVRSFPVTFFSVKTIIGCVRSTATWCARASNRPLFFPACAHEAYIIVRQRDLTRTLHVRSRRAVYVRSRAKHCASTAMHDRTRPHVKSNVRSCLCLLCRALRHLGLGTGCASPPQGLHLVLPKLLFFFQVHDHFALASQLLTKSVQLVCTCVSIFLKHFTRVKVSTLGS
jgi:hypothetical protein